MNFINQLSNDLINSLNDKEKDLGQIHDELEKSYEQVELINQKGELLLQGSAVN